MPSSHYVNRDWLFKIGWCYRRRLVTLLDIFCRASTTLRDINSKERSQLSLLVYIIPYNQVIKLLQFIQKPYSWKLRVWYYIHAYWLFHHKKIKKLYDKNNVIYKIYKNNNTYNFDIFLYYFDIFFYIKDTKNRLTIEIIYPLLQYLIECI